MTPEDICSVIADNPSLFANLFAESKAAGTEQSVTVCLLDGIHLEDRCIGDICSVKPSSMKCETGEPIAHVHTHIQDDQQPDKLSLEDVISWGSRDNKVDCVTHSKGTTCYISSGNPSIKGIKKYLEGREHIKEEDADEIIQLVELFPDPRSAMIVLENMLIENKKQDPFSKEEYWDRLNHLTMAGEIKPCRIHFSQVDAKQIGDSLGINWRDFDIEQYRKGLEVELEHTDVTGGDKIMTGKIAWPTSKSCPITIPGLKRWKQRRRP